MDIFWTLGLIIFSFFSILIFIVYVLEWLRPHQQPTGSMAPFSRLGDRAYWSCPVGLWPFRKALPYELRDRTGLFALLSRDTNKAVGATTSDNQWVIERQKLFGNQVLIKDYKSNATIATYDCQRGLFYKSCGELKIMGGSVYRWQTSDGLFSDTRGWFEDENGRKVLEMSRGLLQEYFFSNMLVDVVFYDCPKKDRALLSVFAASRYIPLLFSTQI
jgi:hypothetical protein